MVDIVKEVLCYRKKDEMQTKRASLAEKDSDSPSQTISHTLLLTNLNNHFVIIEVGGLEDTTTEITTCFRIIQATRLLEKLSHITRQRLSY